MGPLRRGLILATPVLAPLPAVADVCQEFRPGWDGMPVSLISEAMWLFSMPISLVLLVATAFVIRFRNSWGALGVFVGWSFAVAAVTFLDPTGGVRDAATAEGCVGSPTLFIGMVFAICAGMMLYANTDPDRQNPS